MDDSEWVEPWSSLVEGDEQLDRPNSQTNCIYFSSLIQSLSAWADPAFIY